MSKRNRDKRKNKDKRKNRKEAAGPSTPHDVLALILTPWRPDMRARKNVAKQLYRLSLGILLTGKLWLRLENRGRIHFEGDPRAWERLEQMSDDLADELFRDVAADHWSAEMGIRSPAEREYLHLVRNRTTFRWCKTEARDDDPLPIKDSENLPPPDELLEVVYPLIGKLGERCSKAADQMNELIAQLVAVLAVVKMVLAMLGNGKMAAFFEYLADKAAEREYDRIEAEFGPQSS